MRRVLYTKERFVANLTGVKMTILIGFKEDVIVY